MRANRSSTNRVSTSVTSARASSSRRRRAAASRSAMLMSARIALSLDGSAAQRSAEALQTWTSLHTTDATAWADLSRVWSKLGQNLRALRAEAESRIALGDLSGGIDRLRAGQKLARSSRNADFIEASVIDARLRDIEAQAKRRELEERRPES